MYFSTNHITTLSVTKIFSYLTWLKRQLLESFPVSTPVCLAHWGRVTHICVSIQTITGSDNGLSPDRRRAIICTNAGILLIGPLGSNFSEILIQIPAFWFKKMHLKMSSWKWWPLCLGLNPSKCSSHSMPQLVKWTSATCLHSGICKNNIEITS